MRSVSGAMNRGVQMGVALGGLGRNQEVAQSGQAYFEKLRGKFVDNAVGIKRTKMGDLEAPEWMTPPEAEYAKAQYLKLEEAGYQKSLQTSIQMSTLRTNIIKQFKDNIDTEGINPETQRNLTANLEKSYVELLGPETYRKLGIDLQERLSLVQTAQEATKIHDTFLLNGLSNAYLEYTANPTTDNLRKYTTLYAENPKKFKDLDFANPQKLFNSLKTNENHKIMMGRKEKEAEIQTNANLASQKDKEQWEVKKAGPDDELFREGTTYATSPGAKPVVLQQPLTPDKLTQSEKDLKDRIEAVPRIKELVEKEGPNAAYKSGIQMNDDGTPYIDPVTGAVVVLPEFEKVAGKRAATTNLMRVGEAMDDAQEIIELLNDPVVAKELNKMDSGVLNEIVGKTENEIRTYLQKKGFTGGSKKTREAIARIGAYSSVERKNISGAAITDTESAFFESWMPSSGDTFDVTMSKIQLAAAEGEQEFTRFLDIYKNRAKMHDFYAAFGIDRFEQTKDMDAEADALIKEALGQ